MYFATTTVEEKIGKKPLRRKKRDKNDFCQLVPGYISMQFSYFDK